MAREHARIWLDINGDDDFEGLPFDAQGLYCRVILTLDDLNYCGVADWRPRRLTTKAPDLTHNRILAAAAALEAGRYCLFDLDTEEVLARSFIRRDELLRNPKMAAAVVKAYGGIASKTLRAAVVTEIRRVHDEHPEYSSWAAKDVGESLSKLMAKPGLDEVPYTDQITNPNTNRITNLNTVENTNPVGNAESVPIPSTYTSTSTPAPLGGYVTGERHQAATPDPNVPPPTRCPKHTGRTDDPPCRDCRAAREHREAWDTEQAGAKTRALAAFWADVRACPDCDDKGLVDDGSRAARCPQHDWSLTHA